MSATLTASLAPALPFDFPAEGEVSLADPLVRRVIHEVYGAVDFWTRAPLALDEMHLDHVYPRALGGPDNVFNLVSTSAPVNIGKSDTFDAVAFVPVLAIIRAVYAPRVLTALAWERRGKQTRISPSIRTVQPRIRGVSNMTPETCRAGRGLVGWSVEDLARKSQIGVSTIRNYETKVISRRTGELICLTQRNLATIERTLEAAGLVFVPANDTGGQGVRFVQPIPYKLAA